MRKYVLVTLILLSFFPFFITAKTCDWADISEEKNLAREINWSYEYYFSGGDIYFDITATNILEDLYVKDLKTQKVYSTKEFTIKKVLNNQKLTFEIYSKNCGELIATKEMSLPAYNKYYGTEYCQGISEFSYCRKWGIVSMVTNEEVLKNKTEEYRKDLETDDIEPQKYETNITGFYIFVALAILCLTLILNVIIYGGREKDFV